MTIDLFLGLAIGAVITFIALHLILTRRKSIDTTKDLEQKLAEIFPKVLQSANEQLISLANEKLSAEKREIKTDLDNKRLMIEKMVEQIQRDLADRDKTSQSILQQIKDHEKITKELSTTTDSLKKVLTNNQLRGQFGEQVAEDLLKMAGFVKGVDFEYNKSQASSSSRPDFAIYLPDKTKINIDVKFPYANLQKAAETDEKHIKSQLYKDFEKDVKVKINQVSSRDYINPEENTVDFVILFVPNEMIFSYIYEKMYDIWNEAMKKKVVLAGPFSFTAILRMIRQAHDNFAYQKNIHHIVKHIKEFEKQFEMYSDEFSNLGRQIQTLNNTYQKVDSTRTRQLTKVVEKIKLEGGADIEELDTDKEKNKGLSSELHIEPM